MPRRHDDNEVRFVKEQRDSWPGVVRGGPARSWNNPVDLRGSKAYISNGLQPTCDCADWAWWR